MMSVLSWKVHFDCRSHQKLLAMLSASLYKALIHMRVSPEWKDRGCGRAYAEKVVHSVASEWRNKENLVRAEPQSRERICCNKHIEIFRGEVSSPI